MAQQGEHARQHAARPRPSHSDIDLEFMLRHLLRLPQRPAVLLLNLWPFCPRVPRGQRTNTSDCDDAAMLRLSRTHALHVETRIEALARRYGVPCISTRRALFQAALRRQARHTRHTRHTSHTYTPYTQYARHMRYTRHTRHTRHIITPVTPAAAADARRLQRRLRGAAQLLHKRRAAPALGARWAALPTAAGHVDQQLPLLG